MKIYTIAEDGHGFIGLAATFDAAKRFLLENDWITADSVYTDWTANCKPTLKERYGVNWKDSFMKMDADQLENMCFYVEEYDVYE